MEKLSSILKMIAITVGIVILVLIVCGSLFLYLSPQFGGRPNAEQKKKYALAPNYSNGKFINQTNTEMHMDLATIASVLRDQVKGIPNSRPSSPLPIVPVDSLYIQENMANSIIWLDTLHFL